jgi:electron transfer flavoprotein beta subunit
MNIIVLLSAGLHPVSGRPCPVPVELQAIGLAKGVPQASVIGLHAGSATRAVLDCFGHGVGEIDILEHEAGDPAAALAAAISQAAPDLVLAGHRGRGGEDSGLLPYRLAALLGWPICADAIALAQDAAGLAVTQALPRGARRRVVLAPPSIVTVHPAAPASCAFAFAAARRGIMRRKAAPGVAAPARATRSEHPYRQRPRLVRGAIFGGTAEDRLKAATEIAGGGQVIRNPTPEVAAAAIRDVLRGLGLWRAG